MMRLILIPILFASNLVAQDLPVEFGVKYFSNFIQFQADLGTEKLIEFYEFREDSNCRFYGMNGELLDEVSYRFEYIENDSNLDGEEYFNIGMHRLIFHDSIIWGYVKKAANEKVSIKSRPIGDTQEAGHWMKLKGTDINCSKFQLRRLMKESNWSALVDEKHQKLKIVGQNCKKERNDESAKIVKIDNAFFLTWTPERKEHSKWRIIELSKKEIKIEFAPGHPKGIIDFKREN